jgi:hypothetical protein
MEFLQGQEVMVVVVRAQRAMLLLQMERQTLAAAAAVLEARMEQQVPIVLELEGQV